MTEAEKFLIRRARFTWVVKDPYPDISEWLTECQLLDRCTAFLPGFLRKYPPKPIVSPHKAWMDGFNFAWELIEKRLATMGPEGTAPDQAERLLVELEKKP